MVASFPRPELGLPALTDLIASGLGLPPYARLLEESQASGERMRERESVESLTRETVRPLAGRRETGPSGRRRCGSGSVPKWPPIRPSRSWPSSPG